MALKLRRGTEANRTDITPAVGELIYTTDQKKIYVGDGTTPGGNLVTGSGGSSLTGIDDNTTGSAVLTLGDTVISIDADLSITGQEINGDGDISITGDITATGTGVITANSFVGDVTGNLTGNVTGDVTGNINGTVGAVTPNAITGTVVTANTNFVGNLVGDVTVASVNYANDVNFAASNSANSSVRYTVTGGYVQQKTTRTDSGTASGNQLGLHSFAQTDDGGTKDHAQMGYWSVGTYMGQSTTGTFTASNFVSIVDGNLVVGEYAPTAGYRLDVRGNAKVVGDLEANSIKGSIVADDSTMLIDAVAGKVLLASTDIGPVVVSSPQTGQVLKWNGSQWVNGADSGGGGGGGGISSIQIGADDSALRLIEGGEAFLILGGSGISTTSDAEGNITITADFNGTFSALSGKPTTLAGYGITDAATSAQGAKADSALQAGAIFDVKGSVFADDSSTLVDSVAGKIVGPVETTNLVVSGTIDSADSSGITIIPAITMNSDLAVQNDLTVTNKITANTINVTNLVTAGAGTPELSSETELLLTAGTRVSVNSSPFKLCTYTTAERDAYVAQNGDMIYNSSTSKVQAYAGSTWVDLH